MSSPPKFVRAPDSGDGSPNSNFMFSADPYSGKLIEVDWDGEEIDHPPPPLDAPPPHILELAKSRSQGEHVYDEDAEEEEVDTKENVDEDIVEEQELEEKVLDDDGDDGDDESNEEDGFFDTGGSAEGEGGEHQQT